MQFVIHVSTLIADEKGRFLLVREKKEINYDKLNLPGGHLEFKEGIMEGAMREVKEETCVDVELKNLASIFYDWSEHHYIQFFFIGKIIGGGIPKANLEHVKGIEWRSAEEIGRFTSNEMINLNKIKKVIKNFQEGKLGSLELIRRAE